MIERDALKEKVKRMAQRLYAIPTNTDEHSATIIEAADLLYRLVGMETIP